MSEDANPHRNDGRADSDDVDECFHCQSKNISVVNRDLAAVELELLPSGVFGGDKTFYQCWACKKKWWEQQVVFSDTKGMVQQ